MAQEDKKSPVKIVNDAETAALKGMEPQIGIWRECLDSFQNKGLVSNLMQVNIKVGSLVADMETVVSRDTKALLGGRPYMPIRARDTKNPMAVRKGEQCNRLLDEYSDEGFYLSFTDGLRMARTHGIAYIEPRWGFTPKSIKQRIAERDAFGRIVGFGEDLSGGVDEVLQWQVHDPWAIRPSPYGNILKQKPYIIIAELVAVEEIERLLDDKYHPYKMPPGKKAQDLRMAKPDESEELILRMRRDKSCLHDEQQHNVGVLLRYYENPSRKYPIGRWIHTWNRTLLLMDTENMSPYLRRGQKPIAALRNISYIGSDRYWPIGLYEMTKDLVRWGDKSLSMFFDGVMQNSAQWMGYNPDLVDPEDLKAQPGQRIPVEGGRFQEALFPMKVGQPPTELFDLYKITKDMKEDRIGQYVYQTGAPPVRKETATASQLLSEAGGNRMEFGIQFIEQTGLADIAYIASKEIAANITDADRGRVLGFTESFAMGSADVDTIPGGYTLEFKGSDKIRRQAERLERELQAYNLMRNQPTILQPWIMDRQLLKNLEVYTEEQLDQLGLTEEQQMQQMAPPEGGMEPGGPPPVGESQAIANPNSLTTPAVNQAQKVAV